MWMRTHMNVALGWVVRFNSLHSHGRSTCGCIKPHISHSKILGLANDRVCQWNILWSGATSRDEFYPLFFFLYTIRTHSKWSIDYKSRWKCTLNLWKHMCYLDFKNDIYFILCFLNSDNEVRFSVCLIIKPWCLPILICWFLSQKFTRSNQNQHF